ncbi:recombinase family protein [Streptomyces sp. NPDC058045]|uniref:recombinase family protein n=1 Tax=Streptomyces sp. NPDC058045 TaxID=3346311 RepID=UPI0036E51505
MHHETLSPRTARGRVIHHEDTAEARTVIPGQWAPRTHARAAAGSRLRGRPPYGSRIATVLVDGEPQRQLVPDESTAPVVSRIFREYLADKGLQGIAEGLTADGILSPGAAGRAPRHSTVAWSKSAVRAILVNGRYAGHSECSDTSGAALVSPPIVAPELFHAVQEMFDQRRPQRAAAPVARPYSLRGLVRCARCNRLMQGTWNNEEPYYRCRFPAEYSTANRIDHPRNVYLREQTVLGPLISWLRASCSPRLLMKQLNAERAGTQHERTIMATARHLWTLREAEGEAQAAAFQGLGLRLTYSDRNRMLRVKAVLGPTELVVSGSLAL